MNNSSLSFLRLGVRYGAVALLALAALSCKQSGRTGGTTVVPAGTKPVEGDWVVIHDLADPESLNPITSSDASAAEIDAYIYETLTFTDPFTQVG